MEVDGHYFVKALERRPVVTRLEGPGSHAPRWDRLEALHLVHLGTALRLGGAGGGIHRVWIWGSGWGSSRTPIARDPLRLGSTPSRGTSSGATLACITRNAPNRPPVTLPTGSIEGSNPSLSARF